MLKWEYMTTVLGAEKQFSPDKKPRKYSIHSLIPQLNAYGADGWELLYIEPRFIGDNEDVLITKWAGAAGGGVWTHSYLCVFKRVCPPPPPAHPL